MQTYTGIWTKRQLVPCWIIQFLAAGILSIVAILMLIGAGVIDDNVSDNETFYGMRAKDIVDYVYAIGAVLLIFGLFTVGSNIAEAILYTRKRLNPVTVLVLACIKTAIWGFCLGVVIASAIGGYLNVLYLILALALFVTSVVKLVFGAKFTHRKRKGLLNRGDYAQTYNPHPSHIEAGIAPEYYANAPQKPQAYDTTYRPASELPSYGAHPSSQSGAARYYDQGIEMQPARPSGPYAA